jgi:hypothetical protein
MAAVFHTDDEIDRAARRFERLAEDLDPDVAEADDLGDLRMVVVSQPRCK